MLRLMLRLGLIAAVGAAILIGAAFGIGALLDVPTLVFRAESGYAFFDPARGVTLWRDLGIERDFTPMAFDNQYRLRANLLSRSTFITAITIQDVDAGTILCEVDPEFPLTLARYDWDREAGLNLYSARGLYHLDVPTCTLHELLQVERVISQTSWIDPYVAFIAGEGGR